MKPKVIIMAIPLDMMHLINPENLKSDTYDLVGMASTESEAGVLDMKQAIEQIVEHESQPTVISVGHGRGLASLMALIGMFEQSVQEHHKPIFEEPVHVFW